MSESRKCIRRWIAVTMLLLLSGSGCSKESVSSVFENASSRKEVDGVKIIQTTDAGDDVVTDNHGNQFTVKQEEGSIEIYCLNYKTETTDMLPVMEVDADYYTESEISEYDFTVTVKNSGTGNTAKFWMTYNYDIDDDSFAWKNVYNDLGTDISDKPDEDAMNYLESDNMKTLCDELITTVKAYQQLKDNQ